jgi:hypothetical protein
MGLSPDQVHQLRHKAQVVDRRQAVEQRVVDLVQVV